MFKKLFLLFIFVSCSKIILAQFEIRYNNKEINYASSNIKYAFLNTTIFSDSSLQKINLNEWAQLKSNVLKLSYISQTTWLKIPINDIKKYGKVEYVNINNPHINFLKCWILKKDSIIKSFNLTGDNLVFKTRQLPTESFVFSFKENQYEDCDFIVAVDKRFTKLDLPIIFSDTGFFINAYTKQVILIGLILGICLLLLIYNCYLYFTVNQLFYLWYSLYLFLIIGYLTTDSGLFFKYILPSNANLNDTLRPTILALIQFPLMLFFTDLLKIKNKYPRLYFYNIIILSVYFCIFIFSMLLLIKGGYEMHGILIKLLNYLGPLVLIYNLIQSIYLLKQKVEFSNFAFASNILFAFLISTFSLQQRELIVSNVFTKHAHYWAIFSEAIITTFLLAWQFKYYKEKSQELQQQNVRLQQEIFKEIASWQEKELLRLSSLLHDTIGANLGFLRLETDNMPLTPEGRNRIASHITNIGSEVRNLSHSFSPFVLKNKGLYQSIKDTVDAIITNTTIDLQYEFIGHKNNVELQYQILILQIVQELLQNVVKHSKAKKAILQILIEQNIVSIYVEDDGVGHIQNENNDGIGLKNIENLIALLKGSFVIISNEGEGFNISIEFNTQSHEKV